MVTVLIATQNEDVFKAWGVDKFESSTKNTSTFKVTKVKFEELYAKAKKEGYNPYALMSW